MAYKALYRTYRPQTFEEVAGQQHIVRTLKNALATNKIAHAYLFCGPRGTGKTTMAKLFAKALNCEEGLGHQCNDCSSCLEVTNGTHPDVIEIDAASNNGVEQVRSLIEKVDYLPIEGKYKVYIIDEVHMMTTSAFNALLKTLEEPPAHVIFILATTEPHNILPTILSRCQRYDFTKVSDIDIANRMVTILEKEGVEYDESAVDAIISLADGGMRDALSILDQILAYSGNTLREDDVFTLFGLTSKQEKIGFLKSLIDGDASRCLELITGYFQGGTDLKRLNLDLLTILKDVLILKITNDENELMVLSEKEAQYLGEYLTIESTNEMIETFLKTQSEFKTVDNVKTLFEITVLKLCSLKHAAKPEPKIVYIKEETKPAPSVAPKEVATPKVETIVKETSKPIEPKVVETPKATPTPKPSETPIKDDIPDWMLDDDSTGDKVELANDGDNYVLDDDIIIKLMAAGNKDLRTGIANTWNDISRIVTHKVYGDIAILLRDAKPIIATKDALIIEYNFDRLVKKTNLKVNQEALRTLIKKMTGLDLFVYGISRSEKVRLIYTFQNLRQINKLPNPKELENVNFKEMR